MSDMFSNAPLSAVVTITPEMASAILAKNMKGNRNISEARVRDYARAMLAGKFDFNGETIKICENGDLIDGQHRLYACVRSQTPFTTLVVRGLPASVYLTIDKGKMKAASDALTQAGYTNGNLMSAAIRFYLNIIVRDAPPSGRGRGGGLDSNVAVEFAAANPKFQESATYISGRKHICAFCPPSIAAAIHFHLSGKDGLKSYLFFSSLDSGEGLAKDSPILFLRNRLISDRTSLNKGGRRSPIETAAWFINAWNAWRKNRPMGQLRGALKNDEGVFVIPDAA